MQNKTSYNTRSGTMSITTSKSPSYAAPTKSKEIPVLAYHQCDEGDNNDNDDHVPPEYAMIEINGNLIAPVEFPPGESCRRIFGADRRVELGKLHLQGPDQVRTPVIC